MTEVAHIQINRYRTPDGKPTCCRNLQEGEMCQFLGSRRFGTVQVCMLGEYVDLHPSPDNWIYPHKQCKVWSDTK